MAKPNTLLKRTSNALLDHVATQGGGMLGSDSALARQFDVSRTTVRAALERLIALGVLRREDDGVAIARAPVTADYFDDAETSGPQDQIELIFMQRVLLGDWRPGHVFSEAELARDSNASTVSVREFLIGFSRFGLIAKQPRGGWVLQEFHDGFAAEVADMRELIEMAAINRVPAGQDPEFVAAADVMIARHRAIEAALAERYAEFPTLDRDFHLWLIGHLQNRFARDFFDIVSFLFHYHYQWDKQQETERSRIAIAEHLAILLALRAGKRDAAARAMAAHLATSRRSLQAGLRREAA
ncbi:MAG: GntR family transcriptional regulator [Acidiphilium sp. 37-64-53]|uniref:GntR family transcriptional regulator n=1 Tax=Acidiphilium TaxID=522 RepID=UPI000BD744BE|nr:MULTISPECIES: GntR family transcriptional regulator [Acidiphilium]OYW00737.1 MAG: GntR family transcriptional regulator [Acidiphilium sp. 37-64-53]OZB28136.1 MAG: GntR family transcriptional regulator [Acidiphilium sp. 34-64-41]HQT85841.1 GntR family transcriptional regulator [Acidiphilium rubrum]